MQHITLRNAWLFLGCFYCASALLRGDGGTAAIWAAVLALWLREVIE